MLHRPRRLRMNESLRELVRETRISASDLIRPVFAVHGRDKKDRIEAMPDCYHYSVDRICEAVSEAVDLGIKGILIFGVPSEKDPEGSEAYARDGVVQRAVRKLKSNYPELLLITDVCLCAYTSHGHCGVVEDGKVDNDATLDLLNRTALSHAEAGADMVAPSDMMDGRVESIRKTLDRDGYQDVGIMSYSVKYSSAFYGPFRYAADSAPDFGNRKGYQMDPANSREALKEIQLDVNEGADVVMVKPALAYLDIIHKVKEGTDLPVAAYNVSGEYSMIKEAGKAGLADEEKLKLEVLTSIKRAGADMIITYFADELAKIL